MLHIGSHQGTASVVPVALYSGKSYDLVFFPLNRTARTFLSRVSIMHAIRFVFSRGFPRSTSLAVFPACLETTNDEHCQGRSLTVLDSSVQPCFPFSFGQQPFHHLRSTFLRRYVGLWFLGNPENSHFRPFFFHKVNFPSSFVPFQSIGPVLCRVPAMHVTIFRELCI